MRVAFVHPDLGLGGAERLTIDAALSLQSLSHTPTIYTPHQDSTRTFPEVTPPNPQIPVRIIRPPFPRSFFRKFHAILAALRCAYCALYVCLFHRPEVAVVDIVSLPVIVFALFRVPVLFYCHYPDQLLATTLNPHAYHGKLQVFYRRVIDSLEAFALRFASSVVCNSRYTAHAYRKTFPRLQPPGVVYPCVNIPQLTQRAPTDTLLSINRYERKKQISLAIETLAVLRDQHSDADYRLVIAGGYDARIQENVEHYAELKQLVTNRGLEDKVDLLRNITVDRRRELMQTALAVLYTPRGEHFGIVPLEAMAEGVPVVAVRSGGPCESVEDGETGLLVEGSAVDFAKAVTRIRDEGVDMGSRGRERVKRYFSRQVLGREMQNEIVRIVER
eukprot:GFKZ01007990.1.p1 GENE.GFKZ01007990.1~~GFKZ01007990.1.p1  ORF type:complete len:389 (+),score=50.62 GFKZ01007990.1:263-1429(+)